MTAGQSSHEFSVFKGVCSSIIATRAPLWPACDEEPSVRNHPVRLIVSRSSEHRNVYWVEALEPRTMLSVDFTLAATLALARGGGLTTGSAALHLYQNAHRPPIQFDEGMREQIDEEGEEEANGDDEQVLFDPGIPTGPAAPTLAGTIEAINFDQQASSSGYYNIPPDSSATAGPNHLVNVVNTDIQWFTKSGTLQNTQRLGKNGSNATGSFFAAQTPLTGTFDPKVVYDPYNGRFVVVSLERTSSPSQTARILIAVSDDSDPNGTWYTRAINTKLTISGAATWLDYPGLAVDANAVYVTGNMFAFSGTPFSGGTSSFGGSRVWIISKSGLYTGGAPTSANAYDPSALAGLSSENFTMMPTMMYGSAPGATGTFLVSSGWTSSSNELLSVIRVSNPLASPTFANTFVNVGNVNSNGSALAPVPQLGTANTINPDDQRMYSAVWRNNTIWAANTVNPPAGTDANTPTAHWYKISADSAAISTSPADQGNISGEDIAAGTRTFYPAITVDASGNMGIGFSASGPNIYPGAYYTGRLAGDAPGTVQPAATLAAGVEPYFRTFSASGGVSRWGDYSGIAIDPSDDTTFWIYNEYAMAQGTVLNGLPNENGRWATRYGKFTFVNPISATPAAPDLVTASDTGTSSIDDITKLDNSNGSSTLQFSVGNTVAGATVVVFSDGTQIGSALANSATTIVTTNGTLDLVDGTHSITARQTENGKSVSLSSAALSIVIDTLAPTAAVPGFQFETSPQQLIFTFSEDVSASLSASDLTVSSVPAGTTPAVAAPVWNAGNLSATFDFTPSPVPDNNYQATLAASGVTDVAGNPLSASALLSFYSLRGDGNRSKRVEINDFNILAQNFGLTGKTFSQGNYDYSSDGAINITDFNVLATNFGKTLP
jgi:hypothetical protein